MGIITESHDMTCVLSKTMGRQLERLIRYVFHLKKIVCVCTCAYACRCLRWPKEGIRYPGVGITGTCESLNMNAGTKYGHLQEQCELQAISPGLGEDGENQTMKGMCVSLSNRL